MLPPTPRHLVPLALACTLAACGGSPGDASGTADPEAISGASPDTALAHPHAFDVGMNEWITELTPFAAFHAASGAGGPRLCHAYTFWDVAHRDPPSGDQTHTLSGLKGWFAQAAGHCDEVLVTFQGPQVFAVGKDWQAYHAWHDATKPGGWTPWYAMGGNLDSDVGAVINASGRAEIFALDAGGAVDHDFEEASGQWFGWPSLGGKSWSVPAVALDAGGELEAFAGGANHELFTIWNASTHTGWSSWASLGGSFSSNLVVGTNANGSLEVFGVGAGKHVYHAVHDPKTNGWTGWMSLGGSISKI